MPGRRIDVILRDWRYYLVANGFIFMGPLASEGESVSTADALFESIHDRSSADYLIEKLNYCVGECQRLADETKAASDHMFFARLEFEQRIYRHALIYGTKRSPPLSKKV